MMGADAYTQMMKVFQDMRSSAPTQQAPNYAGANFPAYPSMGLMSSDINLLNAAQPNQGPKGSPAWNAPDFVQGFKQNTRPNPDDVYSQYLGMLQMPKAQSTQASPPSSLGNAIRSEVPWMDSPLGHQDMAQAFQTYPFTSEAKNILGPATVIRTSNDPKIVEEEAETNPETVLGYHTGRSRMDIAEKTKDSPLLSVVTHEMMHSYLDKNGYPYGQAAFDEDWNKAKQTHPLLTTIDQWVASSPDYADEMNIGDITQERYAYLAQALAGGGLSAFPKELQRHYTGVFH